MPILPPLRIEKYRLYDIFQLWIDEEVSSLGVTVDSEEIFSNTEVLTELVSKYSLFYWQTPAREYGIEFLDLWHHYVAVMGDQLKKLYDAFIADYNPISNYDMTEEGLDGTRRDGTTTTNTPTGTQSTTTDTNRYAIDSDAGGEPSDKTTTTTSYTDRTDTRTETPSNTQSGAFDGNTLTNYHEAKEHYFKRSGNIGTTTVPDMLEKELKIRKKNLLTDFCAGFIEQHCYYCGSEVYDDYTL